MQIKNFDARLQRLSDTLAHLLVGDFDAIEQYEDVIDDPFGRIEETVEILVMDIKTVDMANRDKEASLLMQQEQLAEKSELLEMQQQHIQHQAKDLLAKRETIDRQAAAIRELSTPILEVWDDVLVLPIIGAVDTHRSEELMASLLASIVRMRAKWAIIDVTGVDVADTRTAHYLMKVVRAAGLLGTSCLLSGVQPAVAQTLVNLGGGLGGLLTKRNLKEALKYCLLRTGATAQPRSTEGV